MSADWPELRPDGLAAVVAANIRYEAARCEFSQQDLADVIGRSRPAVSQRFRGKVAWSLDEVGQVALAFGMPVADLFVKPRGPRFAQW